MIENQIKGWIASIIRHLLTGFAAAIAAKGYVSETQAAEMVAAAVAGVIGISWALWNKYSLGEKIRVALYLPAHATPQQLEKAVEVKDDPQALRQVASEVRDSQPTAPRTA